MFKFNEYIREIDMSLELLNKRLKYYGGNQQQRFINDKERTLKKALLYSYQAATAVLSNNQEFRCLINPDKNKPAYDNKILSIPYKDICLNAPRMGKTSEGIVNIDIKTGDVFTWKQTDTHWLVYLQILEEDAYFRSEIRRCDQQIKIGDKSYWVYIRGPVETSIEWTQKSGIEWNTLNYSLVMYITADENTNSYFERFKTVKVLDPRYNTEKTWQVVGVDPYYGDGIIQIFLDEFFENSIAEAAIAEKNNNIEEENPVDETAPYISGPLEVSQYSKAYYEIHNAENGNWFIRWKDETKSLNSSLRIIPLNVQIGELGTFTLIYRIQEQDIATLDVNITAL